MTLPRWTSTPAIIAFFMVMGGLYLGFGASMFHNSILVGLGLLMIGGGQLGFASLPLLFLMHAHRTDGIVIAHKKYTFGEYFPIVRYTLPKGQEITFQSHVVRTRTSLPASTKVAVLYDPSDPASAVINRFQEKCSLFLFVSLLLLFAVIPLVYGILIGVGLIPLSPSVSIGIGNIDLGNIASSPLGIGLLVLLTISAFRYFFGILKEYQKIQKQSGRHKHHP